MNELINEFKQKNTDRKKEEHWALMKVVIYQKDIKTSERVGT